MLFTSMLPTTFAPAGTIRTGERSSSPMWGLSACTVPSVEIAHTAFVIGRLAGLTPDCGPGPRPPSGAFGLSGALRAIAVRPPGHAGEVAVAGAAVVSLCDQYTVPRS